MSPAPNHLPPLPQGGPVSVGDRSKSAQAQVAIRGFSPFRNSVKSRPERRVVRIPSLDPHMPKLTLKTR